MKIKDILQKGEDTLAMEVLLSYVLGRNREHLISHPEENISDEHQKAYIELVSRYREGKPVAYLTNNKEFYGLSLYVDERVLIPRPETEFLVEKSLKLISGNTQIKKVLDIGTGSGNIAIALAYNSSEIKVVATDISNEALEVTKKNVKRHGLEEKITLIESDLLNELKNERFDLIIANLPYIGTEKNKFVSKETERFEPHTALFGGFDGLTHYENLFKQLSEWKNCKYYLLGEIGFLQSGSLELLIKKYLPDENFDVIKDLSGLDRYFIVSYNSFQ